MKSARFPSRTARMRAIATANESPGTAFAPDGLCEEAIDALLAAIKQHGRPGSSTDLGGTLPRTRQLRSVLGTGTTRIAPIAPVARGNEAA